MKTETYLAYIGAMAIVTYLIRMLPLTLIRKKIESKWIRSFLYYIPFTVLAAMIVPDMLFATRSLWSGVAALTVGLVLAIRDYQLPVVAAAACIAVWITEMFWL